MKRWTTFGIMLALVGGALVVSQERKTPAPVSPDAVLFLVADTQRELSRLPARFTRMSDEDEISAGNNMARWYLGESGIGKSDATTRVVQAYVNSVGGRVAVHAKRRLPYKFHYLPDPSFINAFALPGGHVFIGAGMMSLMDSEDELADVLGHEVEHIDHYHCAERLQTESTLRHIPLGELVALPVVVFEAGYNKAQELEADREGTRLAVKAGYSPLGAIRMFQVFDRLEKQPNRAQSPGEELSSVARQTLEGYFRSHPQPAERIAQIQKMISDEQWEKLTGEKPLEVEYVFLTARAQRALEAKNYAGAESVAAQSLENHADQPAAVKVLAEAQFAQEKFAEAKPNYARLVDQAPAEAGAVAEFANGIASDALGAGHYDQSAKFAKASLDLQANNPKGLAILAEAQISLSDFAAAAASYAKLKNLYPGESAGVLTYIGALAARTLEAHQFAQAAKVAEFWLTVEPARTEALNIQAQAGLALGDFSTSARAFRKQLDLTPKDHYVDMNLVWSYADALSAAKAPQESAREFGTFMTEPRLATPALESQIQVEWAGLKLLAGDGAPAEELIRNGEAGAAGVAPEHLTRLAWWYYRAQQYAAANSLLLNLSNQRPGDTSIQHNLAWVELETNETEKAKVRFRIPQPVPITNRAQWNTPQMGLAIGLWKTHQADDALKAYEAATQAEPRWLDARLVRKFYSPLVAQAVAELKAEDAQRKEAAMRKRH
jgi:predicted Zn-dependent protease